MKYQRGARIGFSLVELLVVIGIIAVLTGILLPVYLNSRNKAREVECLEHLHALGQAFGMYIRDNYGYFPTWCSTHPNPMSAPDPKNAPGDDIVTWDIALKDYIKDEWPKTVTCPSNPLPTAALGPGATRKTARAYAMARYTQRPRGSNFVGCYAEMVPNPPKTVLLFEKGGNLPGSWGDALGENVYQSHDSKDNPDQYRDDMFHRNGKNFLFVGGNVAWHEDGTGPFAWDSGRTGGTACGPGVCELWGTPDRGGDWPPLD